MGRPRKDFAVIHNRALTDPRYEALGAALVKGRMALASTASDTAIALASRVWLWCLRADSRAGILPGDGVAAVRSAIGSGEKEARILLEGLKDAGLIALHGKGLRVRGFRDAYRPLYRERDRDSRRKSRGKPDGNPTENDGVSREFPLGTVAVAVDLPDSKSTSTPPQAPLAPSAPDPDAPGNGFGRGHLSPALANRLNLEGLGSGHLRSRPGKWWEWEKAVQALVDGGTQPETVIAALRAKDRLTLMPHQFLETFQPKDRKGRVRLPEPAAMSPEEARRKAREFIGREAAKETP